MIVVFGSINIDMIMQVKHFPVPGEIAVTPAYEWMPGGKGMNQAIAAARAGAKVAMVGKVGDDGFGTRALNAIKREGILASGIVRTNDSPTGCASIIIDGSGKSQVIVAQGANAEVISDQLPDEILGPSNVLLMQMELNDDVNWPVLERASSVGATTILNLAPAHDIPREALNHLDYLIVNKIEAEQIAKKLGLTIESDALKLAHVLSKNCDLTCIITLSALGSVAVQGDTGWRVSTIEIPQEEIIDTTGAGDTYCGVFAAAIHQKLSLEDAMRRASVAGALATKGKGAQTTMPYIDDIATYLPHLPDIERVKL